MAWRKQVQSTDNRRTTIMTGKQSCLVAITLLASLAVQGPAKADITTGLMGYWPFDGDATDASGNGHDGEVVGDPFYDEGRIGQAIVLDGAEDWVLVGDWDPSSETGEVSVDLWVNWDETHTQNNIFVTKRGVWDEAGLAWQFVGKNDGSALFRNIPTILRGGAGPGGEWVHWTATFDGEVAAIYKNGEIVAGPTAFAFTGGADSPISIGARSDQMSENFKGLIDEVRIYNRALTPDDIAELDPPKLQAHGPNPANGDISVTLPLLTWMPGDTALLHDVYLGTDPNLGPDNLVQSRTPAALYFHPPGLTPGTTYYWRVDEIEADMTTVHTGNVWSFLAQPFTAYLPDPPDGDNEASTDPNMTLTWVTGQNAAGHRVYFSASFDDVNEGAAAADRGVVEDPVFAPGALQPLTTYYWRVDETSLDGTIQPGQVWSFTTFGTVDDFESYTNDVGRRPFEVWVDGFGFSLPEPGNPGNGSNAAVGHDVWDPASPHFNGLLMETGIVHSGAQSVPVGYDNTVAPNYSEIERTWSLAQDWLANGADTLVLYVRGTLTNGLDPLYVVLQDNLGRTASVRHEDPAAAKSTKWLQWEIVLTDLEQLNAGAITKMIVGVGNRDAPVPGPTGTLFFDDFRLTKSQSAE
jgi:hypothetical protein